MSRQEINPAMGGRDRSFVLINSSVN